MLQLETMQLETVRELGEDTTLCMRADTKQLFVVKRCAMECRPYYQKIAAITHPNLARVVALEEDGDTLLVVLEYLSGESLATALERGPFSAAQAVQILSAVCAGLGALHKQGLVHRDVTPNNIILTTEGTVKMIDYGITRSFAKEQSADTMILGTPGFAAPEQFGFTQSDARTDIYAVGVLLNVMLTGALPNVQRAKGALGKVVQRCTAIDAADRYTSVEEVLEALQNRKKWYIPGISNPNKAVFLFSVLGYFFAALLVVIDMLTMQAAWEYALGAVYWSLLLGVPYLCLGDFLQLFSRLPFVRDAAQPTRKALALLTSIVSVLLGFLLLGVAGFLRL